MNGQHFHQRKQSETDTEQCERMYNLRKKKLKYIYIYQNGFITIFHEIGLTPEYFPVGPLQVNLQSQGILLARIPPGAPAQD